MIESIKTIANGTISALLAALIITLIGKLISSNAMSTTKAIGAVKMTANTILKMALDLLPYVLCFWFLIWQLGTLLAPVGPASRAETFMISFWAVWLVLLFLRLLSGKPMYSGS